MADKRPCAICGRWFTKDPRVGTRHRVCATAECRAARNRKACASWRASHPDEVKASRLRRKLPKVPPDPPEAVLLAPMRHFSPRVVRHVMPVEVVVVLEEVAKVLVHIARHEMPPKVKLREAVPRKVLPRDARHETDAARGPP
jgi:hypothetical protein